MKLSIITDGNARALMDHTNTNSLGFVEDCDGVFVSNPLFEIPAGKLVANTCMGVQNLLIDK